MLFRNKSHYHLVSGLRGQYIFIMFTDKKNWNRKRFYNTFVNIFTSNHCDSFLLFLLWIFTVLNWKCSVWLQLWRTFYDQPRVRVLYAQELRCKNTCATDGSWEWDLVLFIEIWLFTKYTSRCCEIVEHNRQNKRIVLP